MPACCSIDHMLTPTDIRLPRHSRSTLRSSSTCSRGSGIFFRDVKSTTLYSLVMSGCCRQYQWHTWTSYISVWMQRRHFGSWRNRRLVRHYASARVFELTRHPDSTLHFEVVMEGFQWGVWRDFEQISQSRKECGEGSRCIEFDRILNWKSSSACW